MREARRILAEGRKQGNLECIKKLARGSGIRDVSVM